MMADGVRFKAGDRTVTVLVDGGGHDAHTNVAVTVGGCTYDHATAEAEPVHVVHGTPLPESIVSLLARYDAVARHAITGGRTYNARPVVDVLDDLRTAIGACEDARAELAVRDAMLPAWCAP